MPVLLVEELKALCDEIFRSRGFTEDESRACVGEVLEAESRGRETHGLSWIPRILAWKAQARADPEVVHESSIAARILGNGALGPLIARDAMDLAIRKAKQALAGFVGVQNPSTFLTAGYNPRRTAAQGMIGINLSVAASNVAVWGGLRSIIGNNPLGVGLPSVERPIVLDFSIGELSVAAVRRAAADGDSLPTGAALSAAGQPTVDPEQALAGALLASGGRKGSGLGVVLELLSGALVGAKAGTSVGGGRGMVFAALDPNIFGLGEQFVAAVRTFANEVRHSSPRPGFTEVLLPGDRGDRLATQATRHGVELSERTYAQLQALVESPCSP
jgi:LDH2 family malate/lactate/ureidoglycolate dehydrogenase